MTVKGDLTDAEIVTAILAGDQAQYQLLVERYYRAVFNTAYRLLGSRAEAADMAQETFIRAYKALPTFRQDAPMTPWLCRIATNLSLNLLKRQRPHISLDAADASDNDRPTGPIEVSDLSTEPQRQLLKKERDERLYEAIFALPPEQRTIIELRHFQEMAYEQIAESLSMSLANVKVRLFRARKKLRQLLTEDAQS